MPVSRRTCRAVVSALILVSGTITASALVSSTASAGIGSDRNRITELEQRIAAEGQAVQSLVTRYNKVQLKMSGIEHDISADRSHLSSEERAESGARVRLRSLAVAAYVVASSGDPVSVISSSNASTLPAQEVYLGVASGTLDSATTTLQDDEHRTTVTGIALRQAEALTAETLRQLASARTEAEAATRTDQSILDGVSQNLRTLVIAQQERSAAAAAAEQEEELAQASAQHAAAARQAAATVAAVPPASITPGTYANPLRAVGGLTSERIDQGVDYDGSGPIYAIGDGVVLSTVNGGWPGGTYITYQLTDGPADGLVVYAAEDIDPQVSVGQQVTADTVIGEVYAGPTGIETGWADGSAGDTMAAAYGQYNGGNTTAFGYNYSQLLNSLGSPGGIAQNDPPTGSLPANWPQW
jgi:murein DD-endopeptidase MepM/ murein hydrolase activator NlpD